MTPQDKNTLYIVGGLAVAYLLFSGKNDSGGAATDPTGNGSIKDATNPIKFDAKRVATQLHQAMETSWSDQDKIVSYFRNISESQFALVKTAFGLKQYNKALGNQMNPLGFLDPLDFYGLVDWLENELDSDQYYTLKLKYPNYL